MAQFLLVRELSRFLFVVTFCTQLEYGGLLYVRMTY